MDHQTTTEEQRQCYPLATWLKLKTMFVTGQGTLVELSAKLGVNYATASTRSFKEKWGRLRESWSERENKRLESGIQPQQPIEPQTSAGNRIETIRKQLESVDNAILAAISARDLADLTKAKRNLEDSLSIAETGGKPGNAPRKPRRGNGYSMPQPVEQISDSPQPSDPTDSQPTS